MLFVSKRGAGRGTGKVRDNLILTSDNTAFAKGKMSFTRPDWRSS